MHIHDKIVNQMNAIPMFGNAQREPASWYRVYRREHLHGFTPIAGYSQVTHPTEFANGESSKQWQKAHPYHESIGVHEMWLLLEKKDELYVDYKSLDNRCRDYGVLENPPYVADVILPSPVFDAFRDMVGQDRWTAAFLKEANMHKLKP